MSHGRRRQRALAGVDQRAVPVIAAALRRIGAWVRAVVGPDGWVGRWFAPWVRRDPVMVIALLSVVVAAVLLAVTGGNSHRAHSAAPTATGPVLSDPQPDNQWQGRTGYVHEAVLADFPDLSGYQVYACGAPVMVDNARDSFVRTRQLPEDEFFADAFVYAADTETAAAQ